MEDTFIPIPGFEKYLINKKGAILSLYVNREIKAHKSTRGGYLNVCLVREGVNCWLTLHRLLAFCFLDLPSLDSDLEVDHKDSDSWNNSLSNLQVLSKEAHRAKTLKDLGYTSFKDQNQTCLTCGAAISRQNTTQLCIKCKSTSASEKDIEQAVLNTGSWVQAGKLFNLSDNGLRKLYKKVSGKDPSLLKKRLKNSV